MNITIFEHYVFAAQKIDQQQKRITIKCIIK